jgi:transposase
MMAQNDRVVVGIDVAKDKVDACIRAFKLRQTCPSTAQGQRKLVAWLRKQQVNKAVLEASGGYERDWAKVLREAGIEVRIVDPSGSAALPNRPGGWPRTMRSMRR